MERDDMTQTPKGRASTLPSDIGSSWADGAQDTDLGGPAPTRGGAIVLKDGAVALIERHVDGMVKYVVPGGKVEAGEDVRETARREILEETGLEVSIGRLVATVQFGANVQQYFSADVTGGHWGSGQGPEMLGLGDAADGTYAAVWVPVSRLRDLDVRPRDLVAVIEQAALGRWPVAPLEIVEVAAPRNDSPGGPG